MVPTQQYRRWISLYPDSTTHKKTHRTCGPVTGCTASSIQLYNTATGEQNKMTISTYCGIPDDILDGIFSTEDLMRWKGDSETTNMLKRKSKTHQLEENTLNQSYIIEIEPSECCIKQNTTNTKDRSKKQFQKNEIQTKIGKFVLFFLNECSYIPFLFMFSMTFLSMSLTGIPCVLLSLAVCVCVATFHVSYISCI